MYNVLLGRLFQYAWTIIAPAAAVAQRVATNAGNAFRRGGGGSVGLALSIGAVLADLLNIDQLRQEAVRIAPTSDPEALEEAARQIMRMTGADGTKTIWPRNGSPRYYVFDLTTGNQWFISRYINMAWVRNASRRGFARGARSGERRAFQTVDAANKG